jgi:hypothetical protein
MIRYLCCVVCALVLSATVGLGQSLLRSRRENDTTRLGFWENLRTGFQMFESSRALPSISVDASGRYLFR